MTRVLLSTRMLIRVSLFPPFHLSAGEGEEFSHAAAKIWENVVPSQLLILFHIPVCPVWIVDDYIPCVRIKNPYKPGTKTKLFLDSPHHLAVGVVRGEHLDGKHRRFVPVLLLHLFHLLGVVKEQYVWTAHGVRIALDD